MENSNIKKCIHVMLRKQVLFDKIVKATPQQLSFGLSYLVACSDDDTFEFIEKILSSLNISDNSKI